jgi:hypothetical protein
VSLFAQQGGGAILRSNGVGVNLDEKPAPTSAAVFRDDLIETQKNASARLETSGSTADISAETMVQFQLDELVLDHGSLSIQTTRGLRVRVGCITITPVNETLATHYEVVDTNGKVNVSARKSDVYIDARSNKEQQVKKPEHSERAIVREGEQKSREESCGPAYIKASGTVPGVNAILNSPWAVAAGAAAVGVGICFGLCHSDDPLSPAKP